MTIRPATSADAEAIAAIHNQGIEDRVATFETAPRSAFTANQASRALCKACGFREVGTYEKHARHDGRWTDVVIVERLIAENLQEDRP
ncbi:MAG: hypothetical protein ABI609_11365 [Acidobacteriota bacterium]